MIFLIDEWLSAFHTFVVHLKFAPQNSIFQTGIVNKTVILFALYADLSHLLTIIS